jgi:hypothetical protein
LEYVQHDVWMHVSEFQPSVITWGWGGGSFSHIDRNPLMEGYYRQWVQVYSKSLILAVTFYFQSIFLQDSVHFFPFAPRSQIGVERR